MKSTTPNPERQKALDKIRKMFALANDAGAHEGEIENALKFAQRLMAKFSIDENELNLSSDDIGEGIIKNEYLKTEQKYWFGDLLNVIARNNGCDIIKNKRVNFEKKSKWDDAYIVFYQLIGTEDDRNLVTEMFLATVPIIRNLSKARFKENGTKESFRYWNSSYITGFINGLSIKLRTNQKEIEVDDTTGNYALIQVKKTDLIQEYIKNNAGKIRTVKKSIGTISKDAFLSGMEDGKDNRNKRLS